MLSGKAPLPLTGLARACGQQGLFRRRLCEQDYYRRERCCHGTLSFRLLCLPSANPVPLPFTGVQSTLVRKPQPTCVLPGSCFGWQSVCVREPGLGD